MQTELAPAGGPRSATTRAPLVTRRAAAFVLDAAIVSALVAPVLTIGEFYEFYSQICESSWSLRRVLIVGTMLTVPFILYEGVCLHLTGRTPGKRLLRLRVVDRTGADLRGWQAWLRPVGRAVFRWISPINYGAVMATRDSRCLHDVLARTKVVPHASNAPAIRDHLAVRPLSERQQWAFWMTWVMMSVIGWIGGALLTDFVPSWAKASPMSREVWLMACVGLGTGTVQAFLLRRHLPRAWLWTLATVAGFVIGPGVYLRLESDLHTVRYAASFAAGTTPEIAAGLALHWTTGWCTALDLGDQRTIDIAWATAPLGVAALAGAALGLVQWTVLRRSIARAAWWLVVNAAALAFISAFTSTSSGQKQRTMGIGLGLALIACQAVVLRWRVVGASWWVAAATMAGGYAIGANEGDLTFAVATSVITGLAMTALVSQPRHRV